VKAPALKNIHHAPTVQVKVPQEINASANNPHPLNCHNYFFRLIGVAPSKKKNTRPHEAPLSARIITS
jgi:hypothetical protein